MSKYILHINLSTNELSIKKNIKFVSMEKVRLKNSFVYPIRMNANLKEVLKQKAEEQGYTFNGIIQVLLKNYIEKTAKKFRVIDGEKKGYIFKGHKIDFKENEFYVVDLHGNRFSIEQIREIL